MTACIAPATTEQLTQLLLLSNSWYLLLCWYPLHMTSGFVGMLLRGLQYYSLDVTFFKSGLDSHLLDLLWNKYWVNTLSTSPLIANWEFAAGQIADIAEKLEQVNKAYG